MSHTRNDVKAMICNMSGEILMGTATSEGIKSMVKLAKEHDLLDLIKEEFGDISTTLGKVGKL